MRWAERVARIGERRDV